MLKLAVFDVDGTLVDSQGDILASMEAAFGVVGLDVPTRQQILSIVGLSLPLAMARLVPDATDAQRDRMVETYKDAYADLRRKGGHAPLYPGIGDLLTRLGAHDNLLLGIATGKSRRGLDALLDGLGLPVRFVTTQVADDHPSKPHPSMLLTALQESGVEAKDAVMIGDTTYDIEMSQAAGMHSIGVAWGYHSQEKLSGSNLLAKDAAGLEHAIYEILGEFT